MQTTLEKPTTANVTIKLDTSHRTRLKSLAIAKKRTSHYLMKEAIDRYIQAEEAEQAVLKIVDDSITHYEATGLHITLDEYIDWIKSVKVNRNAQLPECHT